MGKKINQKVISVVQGFVLCAVILQVVLGMAYIGVNFRQVCDFYESRLYLQMADTLVIDEYTGILYPLLIRLCKTVSVLPYQMILYTVQLAVGIFAVYRFSNTWILKKGAAMLCAVYVNTVPFIAQAHLTVLPNSLAFSCLTGMLLQVIKATLQKRRLFWKEWGILTGIYILLTQIGRAYFWAGTFLLVWAVFLQLFYSYVQRLRLFVTAMALCIGAVVGSSCIYRMTQTTGACGRIQHCFASAFLQRAGTNILAEKYMIYMPEEINDTFSAQDMNAFGVYPHQVVYTFGPILEQKYGKERAAQIYMELGRLGLENATKKTLLDIAEDAFAYTFPMLSYKSWQSTEQKGAVSWNYTQFINTAPRLSSAYARISYTLWIILVLLCLVLWIFVCMVQKRKYHAAWLYVLVFIGIYGLWYALARADAYDYKMALLPMAAGYAPICGMLVQLYFKEGGYGKN